ncbi:hypothetical protein ID866_2737, partial [Astraeus odoratus]
MATSSVTEANQQLWDETLGRLLNLSSVTLKRNAELETRVADLEVELAVWKQAHATALEGADREAKALKGRLTALNSQMTSMESLMVCRFMCSSVQRYSEYQALQNQSLLVLCVIDGDACIFTETLLKQGHEGGRQAAQQLTKAVAEYLTSENIHTLGHLSFWITVYYNRLGLTSVLERHKLCTPEQLEAFVMGFSQTSPRFSLVDVGYGKDGTFTKIAGICIMTIDTISLTHMISEYLQTYIRFPQTQRIFLAGKCRSGSAVISVNPYQAVAITHTFRLPTLSVDNFFMSRRLTPPPLVTPPPLSVTGFSPPISAGGLPTPHSPPGSLALSNGKLIDPTLVSMSIMTLVQVDVGALGLQCPYGERCCWGHTCPNGPKCFHLSKGKCWFKGGEWPELRLLIHQILTPNYCDVE